MRTNNFEHYKTLEENGNKSNTFKLLNINFLNLVLVSQPHLTSTSVSHFNTTLNNALNSQMENKIVDRSSQ